jgi:ribosomal protein L44E
MSVLRFTDSDYPFGVFKLFLCRSLFVGETTNTNFVQRKNISPQITFFLFFLILNFSIKSGMCILFMPKISMLYCSMCNKQFENTKGVIRIRKSKGTHYHDQKKRTKEQTMIYRGRGTQDTRRRQTKQTNTDK